MSAINVIVIINIKANHRIDNRFIINRFLSAMNIWPSCRARTQKAVFKFVYNCSFRKSAELPPRFSSDKAAEKGIIYVHVRIERLL